MDIVDRGAHTARLLARKIEMLRTTLREMESTRDALQTFISREECRSRVKDPHHFAYPMAAKAARERCTRLERSIADLKGQLYAAMEASGETNSEVSASDDSRVA